MSSWEPSPALPNTRGGSAALSLQFASAGTRKKVGGAGRGAVAGRGTRRALLVVLPQPLSGTASPPTPLYLSLSEIPTLLSRLPFPQTPTPRRPDLPLPHLQLPLRPRALGHRAARTRRRRRDARAMLLVMQRQI